MGMYHIKNIYWRSKTISNAIVKFPKGSITLIFSNYSDTFVKYWPKRFYVVQKNFSNFLQNM